MDPTIAGALIGVAGGLIGFAAAARQNSVTLRANRDAARDQRLWEKRSALYEALLEPTSDLVASNATVIELDQAFEALGRQRTLVFAYASDSVTARYMTTTAYMLGLQITPDSDEMKRKLGSEMSLLYRTIRDELQAERRPRRGLARWRSRPPKQIAPEDAPG